MRRDRGRVALGLALASSLIVTSMGCGSPEPTLAGAPGPGAEAEIPAAAADDEDEQTLPRERIQVDEAVQAEAPARGLVDSDAGVDGPDDDPGDGPATREEERRRDGDFVLAWSDEFDQSAGSPPDPTFWRYETGGGGWGNHELQYYTDRPRQAFHDGHGNLRIVADRIDDGDPLADPAAGSCWYGGCEFTSARLTTEGTVTPTYGRIEARIKIPSGQGIWSAFWMLGSNIRTRPWPVSGEIDIMENVGSEPQTLHGSLHGPGYSANKPLGGSITLVPGDLADDFHVYAVEWRPESIVWSVDDRPYATAAPDDIADIRTAYWVFDHDFFLILNVAVGGRWPGDPDDTTDFPQEMAIDWVRVWELDSR